MTKEAQFMLSVAAGMVLIILAFGWLFTAQPDIVDEPTNHHEIISVQTDYKGVVCFIRLDNNRRPQDMSCVYTGDKSWTTPNRPTTAQW